MHKKLSDGKLEEDSHAYEKTLEAAVEHVKEKGDKDINLAKFIEPESPALKEVFQRVKDKNENLFISKQDKPVKAEYDVAALLFAKHNQNPPREPGLTSGLDR
ncbi:hypothetical protein [Piscirickettsia litoralis]|uniref:Uncharacterized protein n=1 Tax=Piscirickettsia litoralis TaxID=1891921 RepID=A0ABX2ZWG2_9GAMM|nr:hypothetical protein [Piscirickettsia litoralis]ODN40916.1 hypothetical protein BGC07_19125 [Piscirickettsia litoralis]